MLKSWSASQFIAYPLVFFFRYQERVLELYELRNCVRKPGHAHSRFCGSLEIVAPSESRIIKHYIHAGPCLRALLASCSTPHAALASSRAFISLFFGQQRTEKSVHPRDFGQWRVRIWIHGAYGEFHNSYDWRTLTKLRARKSKYSALNFKGDIETIRARRARNATTLLSQTGTTRDKEVTKF